MVDFTKLKQIRLKFAQSVEYEERKSQNDVHLIFERVYSHCQYILLEAGASS